MLLVKLYNINNEDTIIQTLPYGEHTIGRGPVLKCFDKRVSRKHAILKIGEESVTLTAVHVNPCFYVANGGESITILSKDAPRLVSNGDKFALLPDQFWYKIVIEPYSEIKQEAPETNTRCPVKRPEPINRSPQLTQCIVNSSQSLNSARQSLGNGSNDITLPSTSIQEGNITTDAAVKEIDEVIKAEGQNVDTTIKQTLPNIIVNTQESQSLLGSSVSNNPTLPLVNSQPIVVSSDETRQSNKRSPSEDICTVSMKQSKIAEDKTNEEVSTDENVIKDDEMVENVEEDSQLNLFLIETSSEEGATKAAEDKTEEEASKVDAIITSDTEDKAQEGTSTIGTSQTEEKAEEVEVKTEEAEQPKRESVDNDIDIKMEMVEDELPNQDNNNIPNVTDDKKNVKDDEEKNNPTSTAGPSTEAGPSSTNKTRRDRCWYGASCYRKHPPHRAELSHPGDDDYDSDPNDDRPTCSYGAACYRKNAIHRQQYKHPGPPAARPNAGGRLRPRRANAGANYNPDDDDYDDPFADDDSGDEYVESGYSGSDTDEEYSQSQQNDEELKRLLKEANDFANSKK